MSILVSGIEDNFIKDKEKNWNRKCVAVQTNLVKYVNYKEVSSKNGNLKKAYLKSDCNILNFQDK